MSERTPLFDVCTEAGATFGEENGWLLPREFGAVEAEYRGALEGAALFDVSHRGKIQLTGPDSRGFLHNLCTNDILGLAPGRGCEAFFATAKAKVIAHVLIHRGPSPNEENGVWIDVDAASTAKLLKHLNHYLISEQVEIADRTREFTQLHVAGPKALALINELADTELGDVIEMEERVQVPTPPCRLRRRSVLGVNGYDLLCANQEAPALWQRFREAGASPAGSEAYNTLRIEAGMPAAGVDFDETCLVMELGRTRAAISYTKGCYLGQEPVVRSRDLGHVNRSLLGVKIQTQIPVKAGAKLYRDAQEVGHVTSSVFSPRLETVIGLAYVRRGNQEPGTALAVEDQGARFSAEVTALPLAAK